MDPFGRRRGSVVRGGGLAAVVVLLSVFCATARAGIVHPYLGSFGPDGAAGSTFARPGAVTVDQSDGDVYVADTAAGAIYKFGPDGEPINFAATGSNELDGISFNDAEPGLVELAVDSATHDLYVVENAPVNGVSVFHADGEPAEFTAIGSHTLSGFTELCGVAVDAEGDIYAADYEGGVSVFDRSGALLTSVAVSHVCSIAVGPGGALYANQYQAGVELLMPNSYPVTGSTTYLPGGVVDPRATFGVAVDPTGGDLYADERGAIAQYDAAGTLLGRSGGEGGGALGESEGVAVEGAGGRLFATAPQLGGNDADRIARYDAGESEQPRVEASWVAPVGDVEATLNAAIDPLGIAASYHFEYGLRSCAEGGCTASPEASLGSGGETLRVSQPIRSLQPGSEYHFRVVLATAAGSKPAPERTFRTYPATLGGAGLADGRGYELVSAGPDNSAELGVPGATGGLISGGVKPQRAAADGEAFAFPSWTAFGEAIAAPNASYYLSRRSPSGWATTNITVRDESRGSVGPIRGFSADLGTTAIVADSVLAPGAVPGYANLYRRDNATGALTALTTSAPAFAAPDEYCLNYVDSSADGRHVLFTASGGLTPEAPAPEQSREPNLYEWSPESGIRLVSILPDGTAAPTAAGIGFGPGNDSCLIDLTEVTRNPISADGGRIFWSETRSSRKLFARVDGTTTVELDTAQGGAGPSGGGTFLTASVDGSRVFFSDPNPLVPGASQGGHLGIGGDLYEYSFATGNLTDLTPPAGGEPTEILGLIGASEDGAYVYFVAEGDLGPGAAAGAANLYLEHEGSLSTIAQLSRTEDKKDWTSLKEQTATVTPDGGHLAFVSTRPLTGYDNELAGRGACRLGIEGQPEGTADCDEVYLFDVEGDRLSCASCNPSGAGPTGPIKSTTGTKASQLNAVPGWTTPFEQPRYLSTDGSRLFFLSEEALVPTDTNGEQDVYEFERPGGVTGDDCSTASSTYVPRSEGCLSLISTGRSADSSYLLDASTDGGDVFISTNQALAPGDEDGSYDIYDARVGGGSSPSAPSPTACSAEGCRDRSATPTIAGGSVGTTGGGGGNVRARRCPTGTTRRGGNCRAKPSTHRHARKHRHRKAPKKNAERGGK